MRLRWKVAAGFGAGALVTAFALHPPLSSQDWAAWVQALGSMGAIWIAVWILKKQNEHAVRREEDETDQIILSLRDEVFALLAGFNQYNGPKLKENPTGAFILRVPVSEGAFAIYNGSSGRIGKVRNHELRARIVITYARAYGFIKMLQLNSEMVKEFEELRVQAAAQPNRFDVLLEQKTWQLNDYGPKLRTSFALLENDANELVSMITKLLPQ